MRFARSLERCSARIRCRPVWLLIAVLVAHQASAADIRPIAPRVVGAEFTYSVGKGDSLTSIGAKFAVSEKALARDNGSKPPYLLKPGSRLKVINFHLVPEGIGDGILINIPQRMLFLFRDGEVASSYPVALGRYDWQTPTGNFFVARLEKNKTWIVPPSIQDEMRRSGKPVLTSVPPGPDNPLGSHWIGLSIRGYGIHGTNAPASIYRARTHGCIRLHPEDIQSLYGQVSLNSPVKIVYIPVLLVKAGERSILVEVNPDVYNRAGDPLQTLRAIARAEGLEQEIDWTTAHRIAGAREGIAREAGNTAEDRETDQRGTASRGQKPQPAPVHQAWTGRVGSGCIAYGAR